jgi:hypothetical protein
MSSSTFSIVGCEPVQLFYERDDPIQPINGKKILLQGLFQNGFAFYDSFAPQLLQTLKNLN